LYSLYPNTGDFKYQFTTVADRWLTAVKKMGGRTAPWKKPNMNYRAWKLSTMEPLTTGVTEPEAAGAIGWLLYNAYVRTGLDKYRIGAEWCLEFLNTWPKNPFYELQLPYGAYAAARMSAELGTDYDVAKLVDWCFTTTDNVREWGATLGNWGGYDCAGLIGEAKYAGYAFTMNGFEQAGALVPLVRYDDRFARAIGKWVLNLANASRLFYSKYLPDQHQDNENWARQYDPHAYIAYEAMRQYALHTGISPYATGDFMRGGWGETNLALYGSSHVGILGGIVDTTNVPMILQLDLLKTDYFHNQAFPSYLYFNPYSEEKRVEIEVGPGQFNLYDAVTNRFLKTGVSGLTDFTIPADAAVLLVITPADGIMSYALNKTLVNGTIIDYSSAQTVDNFPPRIKSLAANPEKIMIGTTATLYCTAEDRDHQSLSFNWHVTAGTIQGNAAEVTFCAPEVPGTCSVNCIVSDGHGGLDSANVTLEVIDNWPPTISSITARPATCDLGGTVELQCEASDRDGDSLSYCWQALAGTLASHDQNATWTAPTRQGYYYVSCTVIDSRGGQTSDSTAIIVGRLVAHYPFNGNVKDASGFENHGKFFGIIPVPDHANNPDSAYFFDGLDDFVQIPNHVSLNCQEAISVCLWMKLAELPEGETFPISHGSWENRWKISIIPEKRLRWTIKTTDGITDVDSKQELVSDIFYHVVTTYNGSDVKIYLNGKLENSTPASGLILKTSIDLTIGRILPNNSSHNFHGVLDEIRIYNQALSEAEIRQLYQEETSLDSKSGAGRPLDYHLFQNYPNPFNQQTQIRYQLCQRGFVKLHICDLLGRQVRQLIQGEKPEGWHQINWDGRNDRGEFVATGIYFYQIQVNDFCEKRKLVLIR